MGKAAPDDDRRLIDRVRKGDQDATRTLYERYFDRIYNYVYARLGRAEDAEDLAIDTMTRSLTRLDLFQDQGIAFSSWVYRIAHNATVDHYRRRGKVTLVPLENATLPESADPAELVVEQLSNDDLRAALRDLTDEQQQVLFLRFFQDLTAAQVAGIMRKSVGAAQALQHRALGSLERALQGGQLTPEELRLDRLAERLRAVDPFVASPGAKIRGWNLVLAAVEQSATVRSRTQPVRRLVAAVVIVVVLLVVGAVAASADSLPDSPLYPLKGLLENARGALAFSPSDQFAYHLDLARTRLTEADAMIARHRLDLAGRALAGLDDQLTAAARVVHDERQSDPVVAADMENRLRRSIVTEDAHLQDLQGQVTNPATLDAITRARDRAARALPRGLPAR